MPAPNVMESISEHPAKAGTVQNAYAVGKVDIRKFTIGKSIRADRRDRIRNNDRIERLVCKRIFAYDHDAVGDRCCVYGRGDKAVIFYAYQAAVDHRELLVAFRNGYRFHVDGEVCGKGSGLGI